MHKSIIFDTETTGLLKPSVVDVKHQPKIIELAALVVLNGKIEAEHVWLFDPKEPLTPEITKITGLTDADVAGKPTFCDAVQEVVTVFHGAQLGIAHNVTFDANMIGNELKRCADQLQQGANFIWPETLVCTVQEFYHLFGHRPKLTELYQLIMGKPLVQTHRALDDCRALFEILSTNGFFNPYLTKEEPPCQQHASKQKKPRQSRSPKKK